MDKYANGLWPASFGRLNALLPFSKRFYLPALTHDFLYATGGTQKDREWADERFFQDCIKASGKNIIALVFSYVYYIFVHEFWYHYFTYYHPYDPRDSTGTSRNR